MTTFKADHRSEPSTYGYTVHAAIFKVLSLVVCPHFSAEIASPAPKKPVFSMVMSSSECSNMPNDRKLGSVRSWRRQPDSRLRQWAGKPSWPRRAAACSAHGAASVYTHQFGQTWTYNSRLSIKQVSLVKIGSFR